MKTLFFVKIVMLILLLQFSLTTHAAEWVRDETFRQVTFDGGRNRVILHVNGSIKNPAGCDKNGYYEIPSTAYPFELGRLALAAYLAGKKVTMPVSEGECGVYGQPVVRFISVHD